MARAQDYVERLRRYGLGFPGTREDHPWGELVLKAKDKVFVFLGKPGPTLAFSVKLPRSGERLLDQSFAEPTAYGLGKSGWVTLTIANDELSEAEMCALIEESYRAVAPKTLLKQLGGSAPEAAAPAPAKTKARATKSKSTAKPAAKRRPPARKA